MTRARDFAGRDHRILIGGEWVAGHGAAIPVFDPTTGDNVGAIPGGTGEDVAAAVAAAGQAMAAARQHGWRPADRAAGLLALADAIDAHAEELAQLETLDAGKPIANARMIDVPGAAAALRYFAGWAGKIGGETMEMSAPGNWHAYTLREPIGVVGQIVPWNYPLMGAATKIGPAIAAGCAVVLKPAEQTSLATLRLGDLIRQAGFPAGMVNIVTGTGPIAGAALVRHPGVAKISFTGSTATGRTIVTEGAATMKRVTVELGGKSPVIVFADADLDKAARAIAIGVFFNTGQTCSAGSRLLVHRSVAAALVDKVHAIGASMRVGDPAEPTTQIGPVTSAGHLAKIQAYIEGAQASGTQVRGGGNADMDRGYFIAPTILVDTPAASPAASQEIFGPVLSVLPFETDDLDEIAALANATEYGLAAYIWTGSLRVAHGLIPRLQAGTVRVNALGGNDFAMPVGGYKQSGFGRENGRIGVEAYTELKSVTLAF